MKAAKTLLILAVLIIALNASALNQNTQNSIQITSANLVEDIIQWISNLFNSFNFPASPTGNAAGELPQDAQTTFLAHFETSANADFIASGCSATPTDSTGTTIDPNGKFGKGILVDPDDNLYYCVNSNVFNKTQGTIEMWVKPNWNGNTSGYKTFFAIRNTDTDYFQFFKERTLPQSSLDAQTKTGSAIYGGVASSIIDSWQANQWHFIATSWGPAGRKLYIDGVLVDSYQTATNQAIQNLPAFFALGVNPYSNGSEQASAVIDEVRISNIQRSDAEIQQSFSGPADTTPPTVSITFPANNATVSGTIIILTSFTTGGETITKVEFFDGATLLGGDTSSPYTYTLNTINRGDGVHTLTAKITDASGDIVTSAPITINIDNTMPTVSITAPSAGATVSGTITVSANASDNAGGSGIAGVQFKLDGVNLGAEDTTQAYGISWNTTQTTNGSHTLTAVARDAAGNSTTSTGIIVTVNNVVADTTPPTILINSPTSNPTYPTNSSTINLGGTASDNAGGSGLSTITWSNNRGGSGQASGTTSWTANNIALQSGSNIITVTAADNAVPANNGTDIITVTYTDNTVPAAITTLTTSNPTSNSITLNWTAPGDDGSTGTAAGYDIRRATFAIIASTFNSATQVVENIIPQAAGQPETFIVTGLAPNTQYYFAIKAFDEVSNTAIISNVPNATTTAGPDIIQPTIAITLPANNAILTSTPITVSGTASDNAGGSGLATVSIIVNGGTAIPATINGSNWSAASVPITQGMNEIIATATDNAIPANIKTATITVTYLLQGITPPVLSGGTFLAHYNSSTTADSGTNRYPIQDSGTNAITYGLISKGLEINNNFDILTYSTTGNFNRDLGTIEFWIKPYWTPSTASVNRFFELSDGTINNRFLIGRWYTAPPAGVGGYIHFAAGDSTSGCSGSWWEVNSADAGALIREPNVSQAWQPNTWHHIAATWKNTAPAEINLYVDGKLIHKLTKTGACNFGTLPPAFRIGNTFAGTNYANGIIDELRILNTQLTQTQIRADAGRETTPPTITINTPTSNPTYPATTTPLAIGGTSFDASGIERVAWSNSAGGSGTATGTTSWNASIALTPNVSNVITVTAFDNVGNSATDTLTVTYNPADTVNPTIAINSPNGGNNYTATTTSVSAGGTASDNVGVTSVTWTNSLGGSGNATYTPATGIWSIASIALFNGANTITVTAKDAANGTGTDTIIITFAGTTNPIVSITSPANNATVSGTATITATASDNTSVTKVEFYVDEIKIGEDSTSPYSYPWNTIPLPNNSTHALYAKAIDSANNSANSIPISVTINNTFACPAGTSCTTTQSCPGTCAANNTTCNDVPNDNCPAAPICIDADGDGFGTNCLLGPDCNDGNPNINPNKIDICGNAIDEDCSGADLVCGAANFAINSVKCEVNNVEGELIDCENVSSNDSITQVFTQCTNNSESAPAISEVNVELSTPEPSSFSETAQTYKSVGGINYLTNESGAIANGIAINEEGAYKLELICENAIGEKTPTKTITWELTPENICDSTDGVCDSSCGENDSDCVCDSIEDNYCDNQCIIGNDPDCSTGNNCSSDNYCDTSCSNDPDCSQEQTCNNNGTCDSGENSTCYNDCAPSIPIGLTAEAGENSITINWNANPEPDIDYYLVNYGSAPERLNQSKQSATNSITISGLKPDTQYYFQLTAVDSDGKQSNSSNIESYSTTSIDCSENGVCSESCGRSEDVDCLCNNNNTCESEFENAQICPADCSPISAGNIIPMAIAALLAVIAIIIAWKYKAILLNKKDN